MKIIKIHKQRKNLGGLPLTDSSIILKHWAGTTSKTAQFALCGRVGVDALGARQSMAADWVTLVLCCPLTSSESSLGGDAHQMCSFKDKPIWIYDNIWQTSSTEWQGWPTASENDCLSRKQVLWCSSHDRPHPVPPNSIRYASILGASPGQWTLPCFQSGLVGFRCAVSQFTTIFKINHEWRIQMFHWDLVVTCFIRSQKTFTEVLNGEFCTILKKMLSTASRCL